jgi:hypothetical protein
LSSAARISAIGGFGSTSLISSALLGGLLLTACGGESDTGTSSNPVVTTTSTTSSGSTAPVTPTTPPVIPPPIGDFPQNPPPTTTPTVAPPVIPPPVGEFPQNPPPVATVPVTPPATTTTTAPVTPTSPTTTEPIPSNTEPEPTSEPIGETTTTPPAGNGEVLLSEDFESDASGAVPEGYDTFIAWNANPTTPSGSEVVAVGNGQKHGGSQALQVKGAGNPAQLVWKIPSGHNKLYVRTWLYLADRQLGQNPGANHETLIALRDGVGSANSEIRFGEIKGAIGTNEVPTDDISPLMAQWGMGPVIEKGKWVCLEVAFLGDLPYNELHAWADGELVHEVTAANQWQNGSLKAANWMEGRFIELVFGWHSFSSASNTVWFDDIVVSTERVGCQ